MAFQPGGISGTRDWIQIDRVDAAEDDKDLDLLQTSLEFVKAARSRQVEQRITARGAYPKITGADCFA